MSLVKVILLDHIRKLGNVGSVVSVRSGYARNYLIPSKLALISTEENAKIYKEKRKFLEESSLKKQKYFEELAEKISGETFIILRQSADSGQLYGSVTARDIRDALEEKGLEGITIEHIALNRNLKMQGFHPVELHLSECVVSIRICVATSLENARAQEESAKVPQELNSKSSSKKIMKKIKTKDASEA